MGESSIGPYLHAYLIDYLRLQKGLRPASIRSYRDTLRLFLTFVAADSRRRLTRMTLQDLTLQRVLTFLRHLEEDRGNHIRTRNQRLAALHSFFDYLGGRVPEMLAVAERVAAVPIKRVPPPETRFLEREEIRQLFAGLQSDGRHAKRDRALLLFLYNTGARVQEVADLCWGHVELGDLPLPGYTARAISGAAARCGGTRQICCGCFAGSHRLSTPRMMPYSCLVLAGP